MTMVNDNDGSKEVGMDDVFSSDVVPGEFQSILGAPPRVINKPEIGHLPDAIVDGYPVFGPGDKIVIERRSVVLSGRPYLDTKTYRVIEVDMAGGTVRMYDDDLNQFAMTNWRTAMAAGHVFKFTSGRAVVTKRKRGRPRKEQPTQTALPSTSSEGLNGAPAAEKKGRGRPKGSKNRPREEIIAAKQQKAEERAMKRAKRVSK